MLRSVPFSARRVPIRHLARPALSRALLPAARPPRRVAARAGRRTLSSPSAPARPEAAAHPGAGRDLESQPVLHLLSEGRLKDAEAFARETPAALSEEEWNELLVALAREGGILRPNSGIEAAEGDGAAAFPPTSAPPARTARQTRDRTDARGAARVTAASLLSLHRLMRERGEGGALGNADTMCALLICEARAGGLAGVRAAWREVEARELVPANRRLYAAMFKALSELERGDLVLELMYSMHAEGSLAKPLLRAGMTALSVSGRPDLMHRAMDALPDAKPDTAGGVVALMLALESANRGDLVADVWDRYSAMPGLRWESARAVTAAVRALGRLGESDRMLAAYRAGLDEGGKPNAFALTAVLTELARAGDVARVREMYAEAVRDGLEPDLPVYNALLGALALAGDEGGMRTVLAELEAAGYEPDQRTYVAFVKGYAHRGDRDALLGMWNKLLAAGEPVSAQLLSRLASGLGVARDLRSARRVVREAVQRGLAEPDVRVYNSLMFAHARGCADARAHAHPLTPVRYDQPAEERSSAWRGILEVYAEMERAGIRPDDATFSAMLDACIEIRSAEGARMVMGELERLEVPPSRHTYARVFSALGTLSSNKDAAPTEDFMGMYRRMKAAGIVPDVGIVSQMAYLVRRWASAEEGRELADDVRRFSISPDDNLWRVLVRMHLKHGAERSAAETFLSAPRPTVDLARSLAVGMSTPRRRKTLLVALHHMYDDMPGPDEQQRYVRDVRARFRRTRMKLAEREKFAGYLERMRLCDSGAECAELEAHLAEHEPPEYLDLVAALLERGVTLTPRLVGRVVGMLRSRPDTTAAHVRRARALLRRAGAGAHPFDGRLWTAVMSVHTRRRLWRGARQMFDDGVLAGDAFSRDMVRSFALRLPTLKDPRGGRGGRARVMDWTEEQWGPGFVARQKDGRLLAQDRRKVLTRDELESLRALLKELRLRDEGDGGGGGGGSSGGRAATKPKATPPARSPCADLETRLAEGEPGPFLDRMEELRARGVKLTPLAALRGAGVLKGDAGTRADALRLFAGIRGVRLSGEAWAALLSVGVRHGLWRAAARLFEPGAFDGVLSRSMVRDFARRAPEPARARASVWMAAQWGGVASGAADERTSLTREEIASWLKLLDGLDLRDESG